MDISCFVSFYVIILSGLKPFLEECLGKLAMAKPVGVDSKKEQIEEEGYSNDGGEKRWNIGTDESKRQSSRYRWTGGEHQEDMRYWQRHMEKIFELLLLGEWSGTTICGVHVLLENKFRVLLSQVSNP